MGKPAAARDRPPTSAAASRPGVATVAWLAAALLLLTAAVYAPVRHYPFLNYDDEDYITENPHVNVGLTHETFIWAWTGVHQATWHPLTTLTHLVDCQLFGLNAGPHHIGNLVLHMFNTLLLFGLLTRWTAQAWRSAWVAALFALHPLHVESVAWISERKDVLSTCFWLLTVWAYTAYVRQPSWRTYGVMLVAYVAALLSKPMVVTLPFILLLLDLWPLQRWQVSSGTAKRQSSATVLPRSSSPVLAGSPSRLMLEKLPLLALSAIASVITYKAQIGAGAVAPLAATPLGARVANAVVAYATYLRMMVWPRNLAVFYPFDAALPAAEVAAAALFLLVATVVVLWRARRQPYLLVGWLWYLGMLVPVIGLVHQGEQALADRFTYLPLVGVFIMIAWGVPEALRRWRHAREACAAAAAATVLACGILTTYQLDFWRDTLTLFQHALVVTRNNFVAQFMVGSALQERGQSDEAFTHLTESVRLNPNYDKPHYDLGLIYTARGDLESAKQQYLHALQLNPSYAKVHVGLARILAAQHDTAGAVAHYRDAIRINPGLAAAHSDLAITLEDSGSLDEAIEHYQEGVRLEPHRAESRSNLAAALIRAGHLPDAIAQFRTALQLKPALIEARFGLATAYLQAGQPSDAIRELDDVLRQRPNWNAPALTLAWLLATTPDAQLRNGARAVQLAEAAAARTGKADPDVLNCLAAAYAEAGRFPDAVTAATQALALAQANGRTALATALAARLDSYRAGQPVRETPGEQRT